MVFVPTFVRTGSGKVSRERTLERAAAGPGSSVGRTHHRNATVVGVRSPSTAHRRRIQAEHLARSPPPNIRGDVAPMDVEVAGVRL